MIAALHEGKLARAEPGAHGECPECRMKVYARTPEHAIRHWAHTPLADGEVRDCSRDNGEMSEWHRAWQWERQDVADIEVAGEGHRADVRTPAGFIIEFQRSSITPEDATARERYWRKGCWVLDGTPKDDGSPRVRVRRRPDQAAEDPYCRFEWPRAHLLLYRAKWPIWIDLGDRLIQVREAHQAAGNGWLADRQWFIDQVINGQRITLREHVVRNTETTRKLAAKRTGHARPEVDEDLTKFDPHCARVLPEFDQPLIQKTSPARFVTPYVPRQSAPPTVEQFKKSEETCCGQHHPGVEGEPIVPACQLCAASPTYWRATRNMSEL